MMRQFAKLGSLKLSAILMLPLIVTVFAVNQLNYVSNNWVAIPLALLGVNLLAAISTNSSFRRQPALLAFHVCLLLVVVLAGLGALLQYDGHVELVEGEIFDASRVEVTDRGLLRHSGPESLKFEQGRIAVEYAPGLIRQSTFSDVMVNGEAGYTSALRFGDRANMTICCYRFSTSFNKGFAAILKWTGNDGSVLLGSINFPSYPEYEWKQINDWTTPGGENIELELVLSTAADRTGAWRLQSEGSEFAINISRSDGQTTRLLRGESLSLAGGQLTAADLRLWIGYRVDSNPMLQCVFIAALMSLAALSLHFNKKYWNVGQRHGTEAREQQHACVSGN